MAVDKFGNSSSTNSSQERSAPDSVGGGVSPSYVDSNFVRKDGTSGFSGELEMNNHKNLEVQGPEPEDSDSVGVNKGYIDSRITTARDSIFQTASQT